MEFKIYVSTYEKYNEGNLFGEWINLANFNDSPAFYSYCQNLHKDEKDPEFMFQDYEGIPKRLVGESWIDDRVFELLNLALPEEEQTAFIEWLDNNGWYEVDLDRGYYLFEQSWRGNYDTLEEYTDEEADERFELSTRNDAISYYFDYEKYYNDRKYEGVWISDSGNVFEPV